jgi:hypothetical protein
VGQPPAGNSWKIKRNSAALFCSGAQLAASKLSERQDVVDAIVKGIIVKEMGTDTEPQLVTRFWVTTGGSGSS